MRRAWVAAGTVPAPDPAIPAPARRRASISGARQEVTAWILSVPVVIMLDVTRKTL
jgi:hypothetical protein